MTKDNCRKFKENPKFKENSSKTRLAFTDDEKSFHRVNRSILCGIMCKRGYPKHLVEIRTNLHSLIRIVLSIGDDLRAQIYSIYI